MAAPMVSISNHVMMEAGHVISLEKIKTQMLLSLSERKVAESCDFICQECQEAFPDSTQLILHIITSHQADKTPNISGSANGQTEKNKSPKERTSEKSYYCKKCGKLFSSTSHFRQHFNGCSRDVAGFNCAVYQKSFDQPKKLKWHQRLHGTGRWFVCSMCSQAFKWLSNLTQHMHIHSKIKLHQCDQCGKSFSHANTLWQHMDIHEVRLGQNAMALQMVAGSQADSTSQNEGCTMSRHDAGTLSQSLCINTVNNCSAETSPVVKSQTPTTANTMQSDRNKAASTPASNCHKAVSTPATNSCSTPTSNCRKGASKAATVSSLTTVTNSKKTKLRGVEPQTKSMSRSLSMPTEQKGNSTANKMPSAVDCTSNKPAVFISDAKTTEVQLNVTCIDIEPQNAVDTSSVVATATIDWSKEVMEMIKTETEVAESWDYVCQECHEAFQYPSQLLLHITTSHKTDKTKSAIERTSEKSRYCQKCDKLFSSTGHFQRHLKAYNHDGVGLNCEICKKSFDRLDKLKWHRHLHKAERRFVCSVCLKAFRWLSNLTQHKKIHSEIKLHQCDKCEKSFGHANTLRQHMGIHEAEKQHKCDRCWKSFTRVSKLRNHMIRHTGGEKPHKCTMCAKTFLYPSHLKRHQQLHHASVNDAEQQQDRETKEQLRESCLWTESQDAVDQSAAATAAINGRSKQVAGNIKPQILSTGSEISRSYDYICQDCHETFQYPGQLIRHCRATHQMDIATDTSLGKSSKTLETSTADNRMLRSEPVFSCTQCDKIFPFPSLLRRHEGVHSMERNFECHICLKRFRLPGILTRHLSTHSVDRNFECHVCNKRFKQRDDMNRHLLVHSDDKQYLCHVCHKSYKYQKSLRLHLLTHTGEKPYQCEKCAKSFSQLSNLKAHMFTHTGVKPFQCSVCNKCYSRRNRLQNHVFKFHRQLHAGAAETEFNTNELECF